MDRLIRFALVTATCLLSFASRTVAATFYIDSGTGRDTNAGTSPEVPWKSLSKIAASKFSPGDRILLKSGGTWHEQLAPVSSGSAGAPIVIDRYGTGPLPRIDGEGRLEDAVLLRNVEHIEVRSLEITNRGPAPAIRRGVHISLDNFGTAKHIVVAGLYIHDINGSNQRKDNGGIIFRTNGPATPSRFDGLTIERNIVWRVDRSAIAAQSYHYPRKRWFPSLKVVIRDNFVDDIGGDGIVPWATESALIEHNIARDCNRRAKSYNAGIWPWSTDNSVFRFNEASFTRTTLDGQGFDSDYNSRGTTFEYNYSHDNEGGFMLICTPGKRDPSENIGNIGTVVRRNISRNDLSRIFHLSAAQKTRVEENAVYIGEGLDVQMLLISDWSGWAEDAVFAKNRFYVKGTARYGHETSRAKDGTYSIAPGWGPAKAIAFSANGYYGRHVDAPQDSEGVINARVPEIARDWNGPDFDPAKPEQYERFIDAHRAWLRKLMQQEFGTIAP